ncbi:hypothetical protein LVB87_10230 [Lysobacter sp. KIS68-7]|uniref:hypothetical protein n=1 Tax=Lysobacter sp. KIS68-7 TaxID=2904252 RepID=UPI001E38BDB2|nr:hypothetical protein [Lysobacter sp. KIS68-7]UHQ18579.1 hypothetical protein LVB87_10230 [Lysobacter sp. KIS68-7]
MTLCALGALQPAFAQDAASATSAAPAAAETPAPAVTPAPVATAKSLPKLVISWDCGDCEHNDKVPGLIEEAYAKEAKERGYTVSETETADAAIVDIRQRPPGVRVMFGFMAGKDRLGLRIRYQGHEYAVSDYEANAILGMNHLSASVAKRAVVRMMLSPPETASAAPTETSGK